jgi:hypothetical protein
MTIEHLDSETEQRENLQANPGADFTSSQVTKISGWQS